MDEGARRDDVEAVLEAANVLLRVVAQSVIEVESVVSSPQLRILVLIANEGPQTLTAIAEELAVHASNATRTCDRLASRGLVIRVTSEKDRRFRRIDVTPEGEKLVTSVLARRRRAIAEVLDNLDDGLEAEALRALRVFAEAAGGVGITDGRFALSLPPQ
ncbi:hypothetical protein BH09ACT2_BH09ACT2_09890 [soil metagenome]